MGQNGDGNVGVKSIRVKVAESRWPSAAFVSFPQTPDLRGFADHREIIISMKHFFALEVEGD